MARQDVVDLLALCRVKSVSWNFLAREAQRPGGLDNLRNRLPIEQSPDATEAMTLIAAAESKIAQHRDTIEKMLDALDRERVHLTTVLDDDYPANLRVIHDLPPFLTYRGTLRPDDARSVAVVGTRAASPEGIAEAGHLAARLTEAGVTVLSGLAAGIDTAAHEATLAAGGRTIAVVGTGIRRTYPPENAELSERIASTGAVVSQFWPDSPPSSYSFPRRNVVTSGMSQGTVVVEATSTSGAKMQARLALAHGKRVFLLRSLVMHNQWARRYLERGAIQVNEVDDILERLRTPAAIQALSEQRRQLVLW